MKNRDIVGGDAFFNLNGVEQIDSVFLPKKPIPVLKQTGSIANRTTTTNRTSTVSKPTSGVGIKPNVLVKPPIFVADKPIIRDYAHPIEDHIFHPVDQIKDHSKEIFIFPKDPIRDHAKPIDEIFIYPGDKLVDHNPPQDEYHLPDDRELHTIDPIRDHARPTDEDILDNIKPREELLEELHGEDGLQEWNRLGISKEQYLSIVSDIPISVDTFGKSLDELFSLQKYYRNNPVEGGEGCLDCRTGSVGERVQVPSGSPLVASGIKVTGYTYSYPFLGITAAGGGLGYLIAKHFKVGTLGMLTLVAAGLMGGSSVGFKVKPPVKA